jgi:hypothetical protein
MRIFRPVRVLMTLDPGLGEAYSQTDRPSNMVGYGPFYGGNRLAERQFTKVM